jgi:Flp pilus assembly protein TadD
MLDEAIAELEKAASFEKEDPTIRDHLGDAYFRKGVFDKARVQWEKALELDPTRKDIREKIEKGNAWTQKR